MTRLMITLAATAAARLPGLPRFRARPSRSRTAISRDHRLRHRPLPALDRRPGRGLRAQAREPSATAFPRSCARAAPRQQREAWANKARALETVGATGINSCSPVGPGGYTGCLTQVINQAKRERREQSEQGTAPEE